MGFSKSKGGEAGGGASGFTPGTANNYFGATSGDIQGDVSGISPATDKSTAEGVRDAYDTANPGWLANYDGDSTAGIFLYYTSGADNVIDVQIRAGGEWRDVDSIIALQGPAGADGFSHIYSSIAARDAFFTDIDNRVTLVNGLVVIVKTGDQVEFFVWDGVDNPGDFADTDRRWVQVDISAGPDSVIIGGIRLAQAGEWLQSDSDLFATTALLLQRNYTVAGGSQDILAPYLDPDGESDLGSQLVQDTEQVYPGSGISFTQSSPADRDALLTRVEVRLKGPVTNLRTIVRLNDASGDIVATAGPIDFSQGPADVTTLNVPYNNRLHAEGTVTYHVTLTADADYTVLGTDPGSGFVQYFQNYGINVLSRDKVPTSRDIGDEPGKLVEFDDDGSGNAQYPAADGSLITGISAGHVVGYDSMVEDFLITTSYIAVGKVAIDGTQSEIAAFATDIFQTVDLERTYEVRVAYRGTNAAHNGEIYWEGTATSSSSGTVTVAMTATATPLPSEADVVLEVQVKCDVAASARHKTTYWEYSSL